MAEPAPDGAWTAAAMTAPCVGRCCPALLRAVDGRPRHRIDCAALSAWRPGARLPRDWSRLRAIRAGERAR